MEKIKKKLPLAIIAGILFATSIAFSHAFIKNGLGTEIVLAEERNESGGVNRQNEAYNNLSDKYTKTFEHKYKQFSKKVNSWMGIFEKSEDMRKDLGINKNIVRNMLDRVTNLIKDIIS